MYVCIYEWKDAIMEKRDRCERRWDAEDEIRPFVSSLTVVFVLQLYSVCFCEKNLSACGWVLRCGRYRASRLSKNMITEQRWKEKSKPPKTFFDNRATRFHVCAILLCKKKKKKNYSPFVVESNLFTTYFLQRESGEGRGPKANTNAALKAAGMEQVNYQSAHDRFDSI